MFDCMVSAPFSRLVVDRPVRKSRVAYNLSTWYFSVRLCFYLHYSHIPASIMQLWLTNLLPRPTASQPCAAALLPKRDVNAAPTAANAAPIAAKRGAYRPHRSVTCRLGQSNWRWSEITLASNNTEGYVG